MSKETISKLELFTVKQNYNPEMGIDHNVLHELITNNMLKCFDTTSNKYRRVYAGDNYGNFTYELNELGLKVLEFTPKGSIK